MATRHYIASGPLGDTVCSTKEAALATLAEAYRLTPRERLYLEWHGQLDRLSVESCDCGEPASHALGPVYREAS